jgi:hypothetical protein
MSGKAVREILGFLGVIASLAFVGLQVRQSNIQARAAAYQEIGIATADWHQGMDETLRRLSREAEYAEAITRWDAMDWEAYSRKWLAGVRLGETVLLQVEQGLLEPDAMEKLGHHYYHTAFLAVPANACIWSYLSMATSDAFRAYVEQTPSSARYECPIDVQALWDAWALEAEAR